MSPEYEKNGVVYKDLKDVKSRFCEDIAKMGAPSIDLGDEFVIDAKSAKAVDGTSANIVVPSLLTAAAQSDPLFILTERGFEIGNKVAEKSRPERWGL